jgi:hypothetical protein
VVVVVVVVVSRDIVDCAEAADTPTKTPSAVAALIESTFIIAAPPSRVVVVARHRDA